MSYQVLARKWRPQNFAQMVGQEHVVKALCNALDNDRVHHAFLFTGTRGVGKTSVARILAKALNCERGVSSSPCGECSACEEVETGRFVDLIEVDAASRTGVDDTRDLLDNVQYKPARGRYKVYLIDEVHMFSRNSFNALLKTLEEPPPHVKFLLATTDPRKLPATVLSRCLQFNLRRLSAASIGRQLGFILENEAVEYEASALGLLARSADGSLRDALSLLDQGIAFCGGTLRTDAVREMLGTIDHAHVVSLLDNVIEREALALLQSIEAIDGLAPDYAQLLGELLVLLQRIAICQVANQAEDDDVVDADVLRRFADSMTPEDVQLAYQIALIGRRDLSLAPEPRGGFEMVMLRMLYFTPEADDGGSASYPPPNRVALQPAGEGVSSKSTGPEREPPMPASGAAVKRLSPGSPNSGLARRALDEALETERQSGALPDSGDPLDQRREPPGEAGETAPQSDPGTAPSMPKDTVSSAPTTRANPAFELGRDLEGGGEVSKGPAETPGCGDPIDPEQWHRIFSELDLDGVARELAANCILESCDSGRALLALDSKHSHLCTPGAKERLEEALCRYYSATIRTEVRAGPSDAETPADRAARRRAERQRLAEQAIAQDPNVQTMMQTFGATIRPRSVTPNSESG